MVTMSDIAQACGVSRSVVLLVLNGREKEVGIAQQTRDRIMAAAEELGYCRNELARAIVTGRNNVVAVIVSGDPDLEFTQRIISGALDAASEQNFSVKLFQPRPEEMETTLRKLLEQQIAGVLLHDASIRILEPWLKKLKKLGIPCGVFNLQNPTGIGFGIYSDDHAGMESAVEYLAGLGHRRIAHLTTWISRSGMWNSDGTVIWTAWRNIHRRSRAFWRASVGGSTPILNCCLRFWRNRRRHVRRR